MMNFRNLNKINLFLAFLVLLPGSILPLNESKNRRITQGLKQIEYRLLEKINSTRVQSGIAPVFSHEELKEIAEKHNREMTKTGQLSHHFPGYDSLGKRLSNAQIPYLSCGENLAKSDIPVAAFIHDQFMQSPDHRKNILNPGFTHCGIKISPGKKSFFITETYVQLPIPRSDSEAEFLLKENLESWFVNRFNYRFLYHQPSEDYAKKLSKNRGLRSLVSEFKKNWGQFHTLDLVGTDLENIKLKLKSEIEKISLEALSLGVSLEESSQTPDRTYSVAVLLFGTYFNDMYFQQLEKIFLNALNRLMVRRGNSIFKPDEKLSQKASRFLKSFSGKTPWQETISGHRLLIFRLTNPLRLPPGIEIHPVSQRNEADSIGISVRVTSRNHSLSDQLMMCLVVPNS